MAFSYNISVCVFNFLFSRRVFVFFSIPVFFIAFLVPSCECVFDFFFFVFLYFTPNVPVRLFINFNRFFLFPTKF